MAKLDIFESLKMADTNAYTYYDSLDDEHKKQFSPWLFNRWMSGAKSNTEYHLIFTNELCNVEMNTISKHPELQWMLLCAVGMGKKQHHEWIKPSSGKKKNKKIEFIKKIYPNMKYDEIDTFCMLNSDEDIANIALSMGFQENELKDIL
jgi:hypothetical protein